MSIPFPRSIRPFLAGCITAALLNVASSGIVAASGGNYGWSDCNWVWKESQANANIRIRDDGSFPPNGTGDGVTNSFHDRMTDMRNRWNTQMANLGLRQRLLKVTSSANIVVSYQTPFGVATGATVIHHINGTACVIHSGINRSIDFVEVYVTPRPDWFNQDDTRRALWESCEANNYQPAYTCSKKHDFGSTFGHELGHAVGTLVHPDQVDAHSGNANATSLAQCQRVDANGNPAWRATMCPSNSVTGNLSDNEYRSERRTLDTWDRASFAEHHARH